MYWFNTGTILMSCYSIISLLDASNPRYRGTISTDKIQQAIEVISDSSIQRVSSYKNYLIYKTKKGVIIARKIS